MKKANKKRGKVNNQLFIDEKSKPILEILKRIVASGYVKNTQPLSCLLIAPVGAGKTTNLIKVSKIGSILALNDVTPYGLTKLLPEIRAKNIKHLIIYDLVQPMSRSRQIVQNLIGFLNSLIEEGLFKISTGFIDVQEPIKLGLITCTTPKELQDKRRGWLGIGFISRMLPLSFEINEFDVIRMLEDFACNKVAGLTYEELKVKEKKIEENPEVFKLLIPYAQKMSSEDKPFRKLKQLQSLLMANALMRGAKKVEMEDFKFFQNIAKYLNYEMREL